MSHIATVVLEALKADSGVSAIVADRIYPDGLPTDAVLPALVVKLVSFVPDNELPAQSTDRVQVSCISDPQVVNGVKDPKEVEQLAQAVKDALHSSDLEKTPFSRTVNSVVHRISKCKMSGGRRFREPDTDYYCMPLDLIITYQT